MNELHWIEGTYNSIPPQLENSLRRAIERVRRELRPRLRPLTESGGRFRVDGIIGSVQLDATTLLRVDPKIEPDHDWVGAVLDLMLPPDRIDALPVAADPQLKRRRDPLDAIAGVFLTRLERALLRDGPLVTLSRAQAEGQVLKGSLLASQWLRHAAWKPHVLPFAHSRLSPDNQFTRVLAYTCVLLARASRSVEVRARLKEASRLLRPSSPELLAPPSVALSLDVPPQWAVYRPSWNIAKMVLGRRSLMGQSGRQDGLTLAIEAWPLLEHLLHRVLRRAAAISRELGRAIDAFPQRGTTLLTQPAGGALGTRSAIPDGRLVEGHKTIAVFDAKYSMKANDQEWPKRSHVNQVLTAAAACGASTAILAYPDHFPTASWHVSMGKDGPKRLVCVGMDMFRYTDKRNDDDDWRATTILQALAITDAIGGSATGVQFA